VNTRPQQDSEYSFHALLNRCGMGFEGMCLKSLMDSDISDAGSSGTLSTRWFLSERIAHYKNISKFHFLPAALALNALTLFLSGKQKRSNLFLQPNLIFS
jgi:hypothetical protein